MGSVNSIETLGLLDGPGIRVVVFMNGCYLRCKYCHNPEMLNIQTSNTSVDDLYNQIKKYQPYFIDNGGVTFSGGEPLLQSDFLIEVCKKLKKDNIHIALDTAGRGTYNKELLDYVDLIIFDIKAINQEKYNDITNSDINDSLNFLKEIQDRNINLWLRQVIVPGFNDDMKSINELINFIRPIKNVDKIELLPYHKMGEDKYYKLNLIPPLKDVKEMDPDKTRELETYIKKQLNMI